MSTSSSTGSIRKRTSKRKGRKERLYWEAEILFGRRPDGSRERKSKAFDSEGAAKTWLQDQRADRAKGLTLEGGRTTVAALLETWMQHLEALGRTPATMHGYRGNIKAHLLPKLGRYHLDDRELLLAAQKMVDELSTRRKPNTVRNVARALHAALEFGRRQRLITENIAGLLELPASRGQEIQPLSLEEAHVFIDAVRPHRLGALYITTLALGLRQSEAVALQWDDVDLDGRTISIRRRAYRIDGEVHVGLPKSETSRRTIGIPDTIVTLLREHRAAMLRQDIASFLVFPGMRGQYLNGPYVTRKMQALLEGAGLPRHRFHDLRHTAATLLRAMGADIKEIQMVLGHSDYRLTANTYTHVLDDARHATAARIDTFLGAREKLVPGNAPGEVPESHEQGSETAHSGT